MRVVLSPEQRLRNGCQRLPRQESHGVEEEVHFRCPSQGNIPVRLSRTRSSVHRELPGQAMSTALRLASIETNAVAGQSPSLPSLIARAGPQAKRRFWEFFTANIRNENTRAAYGRAVGAFMRWCEKQGITELRDIEPIH